MLRVALVVALTAATVAVGCEAGGGQDEDTASVPPSLPVPDGDVLSLASFGETLYLAGQFTRLGRNAGHFVVDGAEHPIIAGGDVWAVEADGEGGWFVGGEFETVGGEACPRLAHIGVDGTLDRAFCAEPTAAVYELTLAGGRLYVGGAFRSIADRPTSLIAAFDVPSGRLADWGAEFNAVGCESADEVEISQIAVAPSAVFVGGCFDELEGKPRDGLAALDRTTGRLSDWTPRPGTGALDEPLGEKDVPAFVGAWDLAPEGDALLVETAPGIAELDAVSGRTKRLFPAPEGRVNVLTATDATLYLGGDFDEIDGQPRRNLAAVDLRTGTVTAWQPDANSSVELVVPAGERVYVAGVALQRVGGRPTDGLAAVDAGMGHATGWRPDVSGSWAWDIGVGQRGSVAIGFAGNVIRGGLARSGLAALDTATGNITQWRPRLGGGAKAVAVNGTTLYVGGSFDRIGGKPRDGLAAFDLGTGRLLPWRPSGGGGWDWIDVHDGVVYAARRFGGTGSSNARLMAVRASDGNVLWTTPLGDPSELGASFAENVVYATRERSYREDLGAFDARSGRPAELAFRRPRNVQGVDAEGEWLYVSTIDFALYAVHTESGEERWRVRTSGGAQEVAAASDALYVGGFFDAIGGEPRAGLAALDAETGVPLDWPASPVAPFGDVHTLYVTASTLWVGGGGDDFVGYLAAFPLAD